MINGKKVIVVLPAYRAEKTLEATVRDVPPGCVDEFILVDDKSPDGTLALARRLGLTTVAHEKNLGYGGNQKTCYTTALNRGADIVIMLHPDYQYDPRLVPVMAHMIASGIYDVVMASRILGAGALRGGMPLWKYVANRFLTALENVLLGLKLSEYHTGYRAYSRAALEKVDWKKNSDDFVFDNQIIAQFQNAGLLFGEITCPTKYFDDASSINFPRSVKYGLGVVATSLAYRLHRWGVWSHPIFR
ncbi:MAG: glycosyltransferase family 2 protein [Bdellovibrionales bacterium]|nr:glycosyltransferase family 2 protein [Bdellovibrionales bacterium]